MNEFSGIRRGVLKRLSGRRRPLYGLRMAPMIDVIFLLLIFFVLTARFRRPEQFLSIQLPTAQAQMQRLDILEPVTITLSADGDDCRIDIGSDTQPATVTMHAGSYEEDLSTFAAMFTGVLESQKRNSSDPVLIRCGDEVDWDSMVKLYNTLHLMEVSDVTFEMDI